MKGRLKNKEEYNEVILTMMLLLFTSKKTILHYSRAREQEPSPCSHHIQAHYLSHSQDCKKSRPRKRGKPCEFTLTFINNAKFHGGEQGHTQREQTVIKDPLLLIPSVGIQESLLFPQLHSATAVSESTWKMFSCVFSNIQTH